MSLSQPILVTGAAGGAQGSTGRVIARMLLDQGLPVRAFVHKVDSRCDELRAKGAEILAGDLLDPAAVQSALHGVKRAYFTYPVAEGLLEASTIFAASARDAGLELIVNNSQFQSTPEAEDFRGLRHAASFRNLQHRLADRIFDWAQVGAVHLQAPPYYENVRALVTRSVVAQDTAFLPWGEGAAVIPLAGAEDVARVATALLTSTTHPTETVYPIVTETPTVHQIIATLSRAIGRPVRYVPITDEQWAQGARERINAHAVDHLSHLWQYFRNGGARDTITDTIRNVTGRPPQTLEEFFRLNVEAFRPAAS
ncbi:hypothetical protein DYQ86_00650 [Acidobacteria bacterium AB60]|nr:hypothetical protein DYQ86_00650 [Acidobacteria bacterium AB60]